MFPIARALVIQGKRQDLIFLKVTLTHKSQFVVVLGEIQGKFQGKDRNGFKSFIKLCKLISCKL